jgi:hypothetical protein
MFDTLFPSLLFTLDYTYTYAPSDTLFVWYLIYVQTKKQQAHDGVSEILPSQKLCLASKLYSSAAENMSNSMIFL